VDLVIQQWLVGTAKADLVRRNHSIFLRQWCYHLAPISVFAASKAVHQNKNGPGAHIPVMDGLAENSDRLVFGLLCGSLSKAWAGKHRQRRDQEGNEREFQTRGHESSVSGASI
jgi:hypothetical protein